jgi:hypothetical protein
MSNALFTYLITTCFCITLFMLLVNPFLENKPLLYWTAVPAILGWILGLMRVLK